MGHRIGTLLVAVLVVAGLDGCGGGAGPTTTAVSMLNGDLNPGSVDGASTQLVYPARFQGTGSVHIEAFSEFGSRGRVTGESEADVEIVLNADGSAAGTITYHQSVAFYCTDDDENGDVELRNKETVNDLEGTHDGSGSFTLNHSKGDLTGTFAVDRLTGHQLLVSELEPDGECGVRHFIRELTIGQISLSG